MSVPRRFEIEQWECPPLRARLSSEQCNRNRRLVRESRGARGSRPGLDVEEATMVEIRLRECLNCRGVVWWSEQTGRGPRTISTEKIAADHSRSEERRRRLVAGLGSVHGRGVAGDRVNGHGTNGHAVDGHGVNGHANSRRVNGCGANGHAVAARDDAADPAPAGSDMEDGLERELRRGELGGELIS
jgi:hypothetical protein